MFGFHRPVKTFRSAPQHSVSMEPMRSSTPGPAHNLTELPVSCTPLMGLCSLAPSLPKGEVVPEQAHLPESPPSVPFTSALPPLRLQTFPPGHQHYPFFYSSPFPQVGDQYQLWPEPRGLSHLKLRTGQQHCAGSPMPPVSISRGGAPIPSQFDSDF